MNIVLVVFVASVTIIFGLVPAVLTGIIVSMGLFIAMMNRFLVRAVSTGETRASRRVYPPEQATRCEHRKTDKVWKSTGRSFRHRRSPGRGGATCGTRGELRDPDLRDGDRASGALMIERLYKGLRDQGIKLLLAHVSTTSPLGRALQGAGAFPEKHHPDWFADGDRALEWAERQILAETHVADSRHEIRIDEFTLMTGLTPTELEFMKHYLDRQLLPQRAALYREGELGDKLFLLARGTVSMVAEDKSAHGKYRRIVTLAPGNIFGESAMLKSGAHSVTAIARGDRALQFVAPKSRCDPCHRCRPLQPVAPQLARAFVGHVADDGGILREDRIRFSSGSANYRAGLACRT